MQNRNMQAMLAEAQKRQRAFDRAVKEIEETEYEMEKNGIVKVVLLGNKQIVSISIDKDAFDPEDREMIEDTIKKAINTVVTQIDEDIEEAKETHLGQ